MWGWSVVGREDDEGGAELCLFFQFGDVGDDVRQESHDPYVAACVAAARPHPGLVTLDTAEGRAQCQTILGYQDVQRIRRYCKG